MAYQIADFGYLYGDAASLERARKMPVLREGVTDATTNNAVTELYNLLVKAGYIKGNPIETAGSTKYGPNTRAAVVAYQRAMGLDVDGVVGSSTWDSLFSGSVPVSQPPATTTPTTTPTQPPAPGTTPPPTTPPTGWAKFRKSAYFWPSVAGAGLLVAGTTLWLLSRKDD